MKPKRASGLLALAVAFLGACGGSDSPGSGTGRCTPTAAATVTLTSAGVTPKAVCVLPGGTVTFVNNDAVAHDIQSDGGCPEVSVGSIAPTTNKVATFPAAQTCTFHDAVNPAATAFQGTVAVSSAPTEGPGY